MTAKIFVNLATEDVARAKRFFEAVGFTIDPTFSNDDVAFVILGDSAFALLHSHTSFGGFDGRTIADSRRIAETITAIGVESRAEVDRLADNALAAGAEATQPPSDMGFLYKRSFADPDGHLWEILWMDPAAISGGAA